MTCYQKRGHWEIWRLLCNFQLKIDRYFFLPQPIEETSSVFKLRATCSHNLSSDSRSCFLSCSGTPRRLNTTVSMPFKRLCWCRKLSLITLLTKFRSTARLIFFLAIAIPSRPSSCSLLRQSIVKKSSADRFGRLNTRLYDAALSNRQHRGKHAGFWDNSYNCCRIKH